MDIGSQVRSHRLFRPKGAGADLRLLGALGVIVSKREVPSAFARYPNTLFTVHTEDGREDEYGYGELAADVPSECKQYFSYAWLLSEDGQRERLLQFYQNPYSGDWSVGVMASSGDCGFMDSLYAASPATLAIEWEDARRRVTLTEIKWSLPWHNDDSICSGRTKICFASQEDFADTPIIATANLR